MIINSLNSNNVSAKSSQASQSSKYMSSTEMLEKYFKGLKTDYSKLNLRKSKADIFTNDELTITLSPDLLKKACKDREVDKELRKSLDDALKHKDSFMSNSYTKSGHKVKSVSFFIDESKRISCSLRIGKKEEVKTKDEKRVISQVITSKFLSAQKNCDVEKSLYYKYMSLLNENKFTALDITV